MVKHIFLVVFILIQIQLFSQDSIQNLTKNTVVTNGSVIINGKPIAYTATTGYLKYIDNTGKHTANMFFVYYSKNGVTDISKRPITYAFNGGPGSTSVWLHLGALGPKRIKMSELGDALTPPYELINNEYSWLDLTDIVFIDPVGTGFSQAEKNEKSTDFYGYDNDVMAVSEFIRLFTNSYKRWSSPKYLVGESYGTTIAVGITKYLIDEYGMYLNGISLVSCALTFQTFREVYGNDLPYICSLPAFTATALYHNKLNVSLSTNIKETIAKAEDFALNGYATALLKADLLSPEKKMDIAKQYAEFTGLNADYIYNSNLRVPSYRFRKELLRDKGISVGRFDSRLTIHQEDLITDYESNDPSYHRIMAAFGTSFNAYVRNELQYTNNLPFKVLSDVHPWKFGDGKFLDVTGDLRESIIKNPAMKVWVANGIYDLATTYFSTEYAIHHLNLPLDLKPNLSKTYYMAGHMMYLHTPSLIEFKKDAVNFYNEK
ncbi:MAG: peptidase S10 [Bacteroidales bacterium]|nr:peptidase S10 [Bacteroidales bacterium]